ncbi:hypothetical protein [Isoptericola sp. NPDC055881]
METPAEHGRADARSIVITGLTTLAWYAVPDVVGPRWARALTKAGVLAAGVALGVAATDEGRSALVGAREVRDELRGLRELGDGDGVDETDPARAVRDDNVLLDEADGAPDLGDADPLPALTVVAGVAAGAVAVVAAVAVAGEKWAYRRGERWRARGLRLPHTRVGLLLGAAAAVATAVDPSVAVGRPPGPGRASLASGAGKG